MSLPNDPNANILYQEIFISVDTIGKNFAQLRDNWNPAFWIIVAHELWYAGQNSQKKTAFGYPVERQADAFGVAALCKGANLTYDHYLHSVGASPEPRPTPVNKQVFDSFPNCGPAKTCIGLIGWRSPNDDQDPER